MNMVDIAPTIASTMGIELNDADGQVLPQVVDKEEVKA
jgi:arylsulfatase A-like enzyme